VLISAPTTLPCPAGIEVEQVVSVEDMRAAVMAQLNEATVVVMAAAVSDYRVKDVADRKMKREGAQAISLELAGTVDILREVVGRRRDGTLVVGFAAETEDVVANGRGKLERKGVDAVVVNPFAMTEEREQLRKEIREFALREVAPNVSRWDEASEFPADVVKALGRMGLLGMIFPLEYGGSGLGYVDYVLAIEELSAVDGSIGIIVAAHNSLCTNHIMLGGNDEQRPFSPETRCGILVTCHFRLICDCE